MTISSDVLAPKALAPKVLAIGLADEIEVIGSSGVHANWSDLGLKPLGTGISYRNLFGRTDETFRRLDRQSKAIVLAAAATGIDSLLSDQQREGTAIVTETVYGSIEVDLRYTDVLAAGFVHGAIFPYTLQSTCIGDVALRHGIRGATVCLSIEESSRGDALREAERILSSGEARHVMVGSVDALSTELPTMKQTLRAVVAVLGAPEAPGVPVADWPASDADPFGAWAKACRGVDRCD